MRAAEAANYKTIYIKFFCFIGKITRINYHFYRDCLGKGLLVLGRIDRGVLQCSHSESQQLPKNLNYQQIQRHFNNCQLKSQTCMQRPPFMQGFSEQLLKLTLRSQLVPMNPTWHWHSYPIRLLFMHVPPKNGYLNF